MNMIVTAKDAAVSLGYPADARAWMVAYAHKLYSSKVVKFDCNGETMKSYSVFARIDSGRWIADCPICSRSNYVDPADPVFYCFGCGNQGSGKFIPVVFPEDRETIESLILARPVTFDENDDNPVSRALSAVPVHNLLKRSWDNGKTAEDLRSENEKVLSG